ncbi:MAG: hypothetical protein PHU69_05725 [Fermentimonas sp.]|jgi:hypothetical protein|nr:hypothetical protein [Fermentimonas sp.]
MKNCISILKLINCIFYLLICLKLIDKPVIAVLAISITGLILSDVIQTVIHELGHLFGGMLSGYYFLSFQIGNLKLCNNCCTNHISIQWENSVCGQCIMIPKSSTATHYFLYNFSGILSNALLTIVLGFFAIYNHANANLTTYTTVFIYSLVAIGFNKLLSNAIPYMNGSEPNDMAIILMLHKNVQTLTDYVHYLCFYGKKVCKLPLPQQYIRKLELTDQYNPIFYHEIMKLLSSD